MITWGERLCLKLRESQECHGTREEKWRVSVIEMSTPLPPQERNQLFALLSVWIGGLQMTGVFNCSPCSGRVLSSRLNIFPGKDDDTWERHYFCHLWVIVEGTSQFPKTSSSKEWRHAVSDVVFAFFIRLLVLSPTFAFFTFVLPPACTFHLNPAPCLMFPHSNMVWRMLLGCSFIPSFIGIVGTKHYETSYGLVM